ncbi:RNA-directed DNA polymerase, eukaryota, reverse transcriptase zinc-binding domain protein, partial [Tanacetum coccineum]
KNRDYLERLVTHEEIKEAVWDCGSSKAPGPDGFSIAFVKKIWDIIKKDLHNFIISFFASCDMPYGANSSFLTLIPKGSNPTLITDFRPISLIGIHYKIIAKILANRLSKVIDKIVSKEQSIFIAGHHILDSLEFVHKWRSWIKTCLSSSRASILVNGSPTSEFSINRGLRQGDPLSPFLFILVMEGLHNAFVDAVDDVIITTGWNARDLENIIRVLHVFYLASGLKINIYKSNIYGIGVNEDEVYNMASNAGCIAGNIPFNYLGLPIGSNMKSIASWKMLIYRFRSRLSTWKASLLSIGDRLTLIKSVLGSLGIYYLLIFKALKSVLNDLERIWSNFFWGGNQDGKKMSWVKWPIILNSYDNGGLNIGSLKAFNLAFLQKWRWRLFTYPNDLWVKVVKAFHGHEGGFDNNGCSFKSTWANIVGYFVLRKRHCKSGTKSNAIFALPGHGSTSSVGCKSNVIFALPGHGSTSSVGCKSNVIFALPGHGSTSSVGRKSNAIFALPGHGSTSSVGRKSNAIFALPDHGSTSSVSRKSNAIFALPGHGSTSSVGRKSNAIFALPGHGSTSSVGRKSNAIFALPGHRSTSSVGRKSNAIFALPGHESTSSVGRKSNVIFALPGHGSTSSVGRKSNSIFALPGHESTSSVGRKSNAIFALPGYGSTSSVGRKSNAIFALSGHRSTSSVGLYYTGSAFIIINPSHYPLFEDRYGWKMRTSPRRTIQGLERRRTAPGESSGLARPNYASTMFMKMILILKNGDPNGNRKVRVLPPLTHLRTSAYSFYITTDIHPSCRVCLQVIFDFLDDVFDSNTSDVAL